MTFIPYHDKIEIEPFSSNSPILSEQKFQEMGTVVAVGRDVSFFEVGDVIVFTAHGVWETPEIDGKKHYVVTADNEFILGKISRVEE